MIREEDVERMKDAVLEMEKESLSNINQTEDKQMIAKILKKYEEQKNDH